MNSNLLVSVAAAAAVALAVSFLVPSGSTPTSSTDSALDDGVLSCGYISIPPHLSVDPNTQEISGIIPDIMSVIANNANVELEWVSETNWTTMTEDLKIGRYDAICSPIWPSGNRAKVADFSVPMYYSGVSAYVRDNDDRFDSTLDGINAANISIATIDGEISQILARQLFPLAETVELPEFSDISLLLLNVDDEKADVTFTEEYGASQYIASNPGSIKSITPERPVRVYANTILISPEEERLKAVLDASLTELINSGEIESILSKYQDRQSAFYPPSAPFQSE